MDFLITGGQVNDCTQAIELLGQHKAEAVLADERCFSKLKCFRRFATRYEKSRNCFRALVALACAWLHLRLYVDTT